MHYSYFGHHFDFYITSFYLKKNLKMPDSEEFSSCLEKLLLPVDFSYENSP